eukprot:3195593-Amphidinium_carterae.1
MLSHPPRLLRPTRSYNYTPLAIVSVVQYEPAISMRQHTASAVHVYYVMDADPRSIQGGACRCAVITCSHGAHKYS